MGRYRTKIEGSGFDGEFEFVVPQAGEFTAARRGLPLLSLDKVETDEGAEPPKDLTPAQQEERERRALAVVEFGDRLLLKCIRYPRLVETWRDPIDSLPKGTVVLDEIAIAERQRVATELLHAGGFGQAAEDVRPLSEAPVS